MDFKIFKGVLKMEEEYKVFNGYRIYPDGKIFGVRNKFLKPDVTKIGYEQVF